MIVGKSVSLGLVERLRVDQVRIGASVALCCAILMIWATFAMLANDERLAIWRQAQISASNTGRIVALDISRNLYMLDLTLRNLENGLSFPGLDKLPLKERNQVLYDGAASAAFFAKLIVLNERGDLTIDSGGTTPPPLNYADREYFQFLRDHPAKQMYLSAPAFSKMGVGWTMPMARRLTQPDGVFAGVVVGGLRLDYINGVFQQVNLGVDDAIALIRSDGTVAARWPERPSTIGFVADAPSFVSGEGVLRGRSSLDGQQRLWVSSPIGAYPLRVVVEVSTSALFDAWYRRATAIGLGLLFLSGLVAVLVLWLTRELRRRTSSEASLAQKNIELTARREQFDAALGNMSQGLTFFDRERKLIVCNRRYAEMFGLTPHQTKAGTSLRDIIRHRIEAGAFPDVAPSEYLARFDPAALAAQPSEATDVLQDGRIVASHYQPLPDDAWVTTHEDITERRAIEENLVFMARHDALTRLPNRVLFQERLDQAVEMAGRGVRCAVICVDLDRFKEVNDSLGHPVGDGLLRAVGLRLRACVRDVDTVARLGGDEFAVIQLHINGPEDAEVLSKRIIAALEEPFSVDEHRIAIGASIGIAVVAEDKEVTSERLLKNAEVALYLSKKDGRGTVRFFDPEVEARMQLRRELELELSGALAREEFELYYQPLVNLLSGRVSGFEALLRWHHPARGLVGAAEFIPIAEDTGLIVAIGHWVLRSACFEATIWPAGISVAVNLSPVQFKMGNVVTAVEAALQASGLSPNRLELEITESVLLLETEDNLTTLHRLRGLGVAVALDDFGTGFSSLSYVRSFPFDKIKIDQSFVRDLMKTKESGLIIRAVTALGQSLGIRTLVEGVETMEQSEKLREQGCTEAQGYFFGPPKPASDVQRLIGSIENRHSLSGM